MGILSDCDGPSYPTILHERTMRVDFCQRTKWSPSNDRSDAAAASCAVKPGIDQVPLIELIPEEEQQRAHAAGDLERLHGSQ